MPSPEWKARTFRDDWRPGDTVNMSIGQGYLQVTPIQLANVVAQIVNGGVVYRPRVVRETRDAVTGRVLSEFEPEISRISSISPATYEQVREAMREVVESGTASVVLTTPVPLSGKTGTAQTSVQDAKHSWFIGFADSQIDGVRETLVSVVWIDASNEWDWWAPYATNIIMHGIYNDLDFTATIEDLRRLRDPWLWYGNGLP